MLRRPHRLWALLGDPGAGKTTVLRYAALRLIEELYLKATSISSG